MHAGVAEVSVERAFVVEVGHHLAQVAKISAEFFGSDGGIFPAFPVQRLAGNVRGCAQTGFANLPDAACLRSREQLDVRRSGAAAKRVDQALGLQLGSGERLAAELDHQPSAAFGKQREAFRIDAFRALVVNEEIVEAFEADGLVLENFGDVVGALIDVRIGDDERERVAEGSRRGGMSLRELWRRFLRSRRARGQCGSRFPGEDS